MSRFISNSSRVRIARSLLSIIFVPHLALCQTTAQEYYDRGNDQLKAGRFDEAITDYSKAIKLNSKYVKAYNKRGIAWAKKGQPDAAIADFTKAVELDPKCAEAYNNRGNTETNLDASIADFSKAIELNQRDADAYNNRGFDRYRKGQHDAAIADFNRTIELNPRNANAYNNRGIVRYSQGQYDAAIADYDRALKIDPKLTVAQENRDLAVKAKADEKQAPNGGSVEEKSESDESNTRQVLTRAEAVIAEQLKTYWTPNGFDRSPIEIDFQANPRYQKLTEDYPSLWKQATSSLGSLYATREKAVNRQLRPDADKFRKMLVDAIESAVALRGGGSASGVLSSLSEAEAEWIIANLSSHHGEHISDNDFQSALAVHISERPANVDVKPVLDKLHRVESFLNPAEANYLRSEFLAYFKKYSYGTPE